MRSTISKVMIAVAGSLLPVAIVLALLTDSPLWAGLVGWFVVASALVLLGLAIRRTHP